MDEPVVYLVARGHIAEKRHEFKTAREAVEFLSGETPGKWIVVLDDGPHQAVFVPNSSDALTIERQMNDVWVRSLS